MKHSYFYIDVEKASRLGIIGLNLKLNGKRVGRCVKAKIGPKGFVEYLSYTVRNGEVITVRKYGKVTMQLPKHSSCRVSRERV